MPIFLLSSVRCSHTHWDQSRKNSTWPDCTTLITLKRLRLQMQVHLRMSIRESTWKSKRLKLSRCDKTRCIKRSWWSRSQKHSSKNLSGESIIWAWGGCGILLLLKCKTTRETQRKIKVCLCKLPSAETRSQSQSRICIELPDLRSYQRSKRWMRTYRRSRSLTNNYSSSITVQASRTWGVPTLRPVPRWQLRNTSSCTCTKQHRAQASQTRNMPKSSGTTCSSTCRYIMSASRDSGCRLHRA